MRCRRRKSFSGNGLKDGVDYRINAVGAGPFRLKAMLEGGDNAAAIMNLPFSAQTIEAGLKSLGRTVDLLGPYQAGGAFVLRAWAKANPDVLERYLAGYVESLRWVLDKTNRDEAIALLMSKRNLSRSLATRSYDLMIEPGFGFNPDARLSAEGFDNVLKLRQEVEGGPAPDPAKYLDLSYYDRALKRSALNKSSFGVQISMLKRSSDNRLNGGQVIVDYLIREKVPYAFGLCGHGNIQFIDALHERQSDIKTISVHHESVCGFMADAYYRVKGQPVATFTSCGPGSANLPIALATAYLDSVPFLAVTGNVPTSAVQPRRVPGAVPAAPGRLPSTVRSICKRVYQPTRGEQVPHAVRQAWKTMVTGRPGPVVLDVPFDVFMESAAEETPKPEEWSANISSRCGADPDGVKKAVDMLLKAERPVILVGQAVKLWRRDGRPADAGREAANPGRRIR